MTAHRRAWTLRASLAALMAAGALLGFTSPASAAPDDDPTITNLALDNASLQPGSQATLTFTVTGGTAQPSGSTNISISSSLSDVTVKVTKGCAGTVCVVNFNKTGDSTDFTVTLVAAQNPSGVPAGQQRSGSIKIEVDPTTGGTVNKNQPITLRGAATQAPTGVTQVTGSVKDVATGAAIPGAAVTLQDSAGHNFTATTNNLGAFSFRSTQNNPIAPGTLAVGAQKTGYKEVTASANVQAGQSYSFPPLQLESTTSSAAPSDVGSAPVVAAPTDTVSVAPLDPQSTAGKDSGGGFSTILIAAGALLVLLGIGAIVLILVRRRRDEGEDVDDMDDAPGPRRGPTPVPASRGNYRGAPDATSVVRSGAYSDPTMVGRGSPLADAPTTMHPPVPPVDEYPDPYGAPPPRPSQPGYGGGGYDSGGQYGGGGNTYGGTNNYSSGGGYDDRPGGNYSGGDSSPHSGLYGQPEEPTRGYDAGGYDAPAPRSGGGYDAGNYGGGGGGYDAPAHRSGGSGYDPGYQQPRSGGYDQPTSGGGYRDSGGYGGPRDSGSRDSGPRDGSSRDSGPRDSGYPPADEYNQRGGYDNGRRGSQPPPGSRGRLDWLDD